MPLCNAAGLSADVARSRASPFGNAAATGRVVLRQTWLALWDTMSYRQGDDIQSASLRRRRSGNDRPFRFYN